ncbi:disks large homolog 5-like isoform X6 [Rattus norvegicus]|uniref:disks large homolog 5-like isoform X6 n=1 Tax=Rattus norvegicus TaxID=10116 RepID=UPI002FD7D1BF
MMDKDSTSGEEPGRETSSTGTALSEKQAKKEKERLIKELQLITEERNDLRDRLRFLTERSMKNRPHFRANPYYEDLERMEEAVMSILHNLEMENTEIHENNHKLKKEMTFSRSQKVQESWNWTHTSKRAS